MGVANGRSQVMGRVNGRSQVMAERSVYSNFSILIPYTSRQDGGKECGKRQASLSSVSSL